MSNLKKENGQSLVEFALILPILLLLVFSIIDFGMLFYTKNQLETISYNAARTISLGDTYTLPSGVIGVSVNYTPSSPYTAGQQVTVTANEDYTALTPILQILFNSNVVHLKNTTYIVIEV
ncbi:MAG: pilus assembly protein [Desulfosporosinus sp.]|nr:pilus assembly protein [Desulfosporosinus sp.]